MMYRTNSYTENAWDVFWYEKNLQGDIIAVYNSAGTKVATYTYSDAWGNYTVSYSNSGATTGAQYNPFKYRGYYYDSDLGMYYLQSRYYDAKICRFINADSALYHSMLGFNLFAYCNNNPVNYYDYTGKLCVAIKDDDGNPLNDWILEGAGAGGYGATGNYFGYGTAYYNYSVYSSTAAYDAYLGGYYSSPISSAAYNLYYYYVPNAVSVVDNMATDRGAVQTKSHTNDSSINNYFGRTLPVEGPVNSISSLYFDGILKQQRIYGSDGKAIIDIDYFHPGPNHKFPHVHFFDWSKTPPRGEAINLFD